MSGASTNASTAEAEADRIAAIEIEEPEGFESGSGETGAVGGHGRWLLNQDEFYEMFSGFFEITAFGAEMAGRPLPSLPIQEGEQEQARRASDALYRLAERNPRWLGWMLQPGNETVQLLIPIGVFAFGKARAVAGDLRAGKAKKIGPISPDKPAAPDHPHSVQFNFVPEDEAA